MYSTFLPSLPNDCDSQYRNQDDAESRKRLQRDFPEKVRPPGTLPRTSHPTHGRNKVPSATELGSIVSRC